MPPEEVTRLLPRSHASLPTLPGPPPEVLAEIGEAWERAQDGAADGLELHFESEPRLARAWGALRRPDGRVVEHLPASVAVAICMGDLELRPPLAAAV